MTAIQRTIQRQGRPLCKPRSRKGRPRRHGRRRYRQQLLCRRRERKAKKRAVALTRLMKKRGVSMENTAESIGLQPGTLRQWCRDWKREQMPLRLKGRPAEEVSPFWQEEVLGVLLELGADTGMPTLRETFPDVPYRALEDLLLNCRRLLKRGKTEHIRTLNWTAPGTVWAMDHTEPQNAIDGEYRRILVVRDLASGRTLAALPVRRETMKSTAELLRALFAAYGAPLVIKSDNHGSLTGKTVSDTLDEYGVAHLISPPYWPKYNGACESGMGGLKTRAHHIAAQYGREAGWSCDDVEAARLACNGVVGQDGTTPDQRWRNAEAPDERERAAFFHELGVTRKELDAEAKEEENALGNKEQIARTARVKREAIARALGRLGYFTVRRRRIPLHNESRKCA